jgi:hypothetical protein
VSWNLESFYYRKSSFVSFREGYGVDASGPSNVWAVGAVYLPTNGTQHDLVFRYDGTAWRTVSKTGLPGNETLRAVDAVSPTDVWVAGYRSAGIAVYSTMVAHGNGTSWTQESTPNGNPGGFNNLNGVAAAGGTVSVGRSNGAPLVLRWDGASWTRDTTPTVTSNPYPGPNRARLSIVDIEPITCQPAWLCPEMNAMMSRPTTSANPRSPYSPAAHWRVPASRSDWTPRATCNTSRSGGSLPSDWAR